MLCFRYKKLLVPYAECALDEKARARVERHLSGCASCRAELECVKSVSDALRSSEVPAAEPSAELWSRVREQIQAEPTPSPRRFALPQTAYAFAGALLVGVVGWGMFRAQPSPEYPMQMAQRREAKKPVEQPPPAGRPRMLDGTAKVVAKAPPKDDTEEPAPANRPSTAASAGPVAAPRVEAKRPSEPVRMAKSGAYWGHTEGVRELEKADKYESDLKDDTTAVSSPARPPAAPVPAATAARACGASDATELASAMPGGVGDAPRTRASTAKDSPNGKLGVVSGALRDDLRSNEADRYLELGNTQMAQGQKVEAGQSYNRAYLNSDPKTWVSITDTVEKAGGLKATASEARLNFRNTNDRNSGLVLYTLQSRQKDTAGMVITARRLVKLHPDDPSLWLKLGEAYEAAGNRTGAIQAYEKAAALPDKQVAATASSRVRHLKTSGKQTDRN